jgi:DNA-binding CsgD family transcriptional regulator
VTEVAGVDEPLRALDDVVAAGLAVVVDEPGSRELAVAHPLVRAAILEDLAPSRLAAVHRAAGRTLPGAAGLGHRIAGTVGHDAGLAAEARSVAAAEASTGAHAACARLLLEARRVEPDATKADGDLLAAVDHLLLAGELAAAAGLRRRVDSLQASARRDEVLGHLAYVLGPRADARGHLERAWTEIGDPRAPLDAALAGRIAGRLATIAVDRGDGADAQAWVRRSRRLAPDWAAEGNQGHMLAMSYALLGRIDEGTAELTGDLDRVAAAASAAIDAPLVDVLLGRGVLRMWAGDLTGAADDLAACLATGAGGSFVARETARYSLAEVHFRAGRWDAAVVAAEVAAAIADAADQAWIAPFPHAVAVYPLAARGEWTRAEEHLAAAGAAAERAAGGAARLWIALAAARLAESRGDPAGVVEVCDRLARGDRSARHEGIAGWRATYAEALIAVGRADDAAEVVAWLAADVGPDASPDIRADLARAEALVAAAAGDRDRAEGIVRRALADEDNPATPFSQARLELVAGGLWRSGGAPDQAVGVLERARSRFEALGAEPWRARAENELARAGRRPARRQPTAAALTPQEQAVVHVVAAGRSNREAAAELFISVKTVEHHLSRAYAKLGVRSRAELVGALAAPAPTADAPATPTPAARRPPADVP